MSVDPEVTKTAETEPEMRNRAREGSATPEQKYSPLAGAVAEMESEMRIRTREGFATREQKYSLLAGAVYLAAGVFGFFVTGFGDFTGTTGNALLGIFTLNPYHNVVNIIVGVLWLLGAFLLTPPETEGLNLALGIICAMGTVLGFLGYLTALAVNSGLNPDNILHLVTAVVTLVFGTGLLRVFGGGSRIATA